MLNEEKSIPELSGQQIEFMTLSEIKVIRQATSDPAHFTALYRQYVTRVYRYIFLRVNNHDEAEDLTAQVFMAVRSSASS